MTSEFLSPTAEGGVRIFERGTLSPADNNTLFNHNVFDDNGMKSLKIEYVKLGIEKVLKALKFADWEAESS